MQLKGSPHFFALVEVRRSSRVTPRPPLQPARRPAPSTSWEFRKRHTALRGSLDLCHWKVSHREPSGAAEELLQTLPGGRGQSVRPEEPGVLRRMMQTVQICGRERQSWVKVLA
ncbi:uncharacterized protein [Taeniopygia guttata]|uniref:uncharacterized protein isoform X2 n=1 Tax=Taeniopygia guttata TaxID=59729 RepID=UPI003BB8F5F5